jgi:hypothetical protein
MATMRDTPGDAGVFLRADQSSRADPASQLQVMIPGISRG